VPSPNLSEIVTSTLRNRSGETADNVSKGNALLFRLKEKGAWKAVSGRTIVRELEYAEGRFQWYSGYDLLDISPADVLTGAEWNWAQAAGIVSASGLEIDVQNTGKEQVIDLFETRIKNAQKTMKNQLNYGCWSDGTAYSGKIVGGLQLMVADNPATGTFGGINRSNFTFWRNQFYRATADGGASLSAATIQRFLNALTLRCTRGTDKPDLYLSDAVNYGYYWDSLQAIQRITKESNGKAGAGFRSLDYAGQDFVYEDSTGIPAEHTYALNTDYIQLCYAKKRNFTPLPEDRAFNQDAFIQLILWAGQLVATNCSLQGVLYDNA
jgi:hypothetical protein